MFSVCKVSCNMLVCRDAKSLKCRLNCSCGLCHTVNKGQFSVCENGSILCFGILSTLVNYGTYKKNISLLCKESYVFLTNTEVFIKTKGQ